MTRRKNIRSLASLLAVLVRNRIIRPDEAGYYCTQYLNRAASINEIINSIYEHEFDNNGLVDNITNALMRIEEKNQRGEQ